MVRKEAAITIVMVERGIANIKTVLKEVPTCSSGQVLANSLGYNAKAREAENPITFVKVNAA
jgi:hypothetical protein